MASLFSTTPAWRQRRWRRFDTAAPPPGESARAIAVTPVQASPLVLPASLIGLSDPFGVAFIRTPSTATSAVSEGGPAGFAQAAPADQAPQGPIGATIGADRGLRPIRVDDDVIETRIAAPEITVARLDPFAAAPLRAVPPGQPLAPDADDRWRLGATTGVLTVTRLAVAAVGALVGRARASGRISGLLAAAPPWRPRPDARPGPGRGEEAGRRRRGGPFRASPPGRACIGAGRPLPARADAL